MTFNQDMAIKIAWKYYNEGLTQTEIANALNLSRMRVIKYLDFAKTNNIIQFKININKISDPELQNKLMEKYNLNDIYIVPSINNNNIDSIAIAAAQYIEDRITTDTMINIGYGEAVSRTLGHLSISSKFKVAFVSLTGGVKFYMPTAIDQSSDYYTNSNYSHYIIPSPLIVSNENLATELKQEKSIHKILGMVPHSNLTVIGIGALNERATLVKEGHLNIQDIEIFKSKGAVGDLLNQFYDIDGNVINLELHKRLITTNINLLKSLNHVVAIASGVEKKEAILGALKGGYIDVLITDETIAYSLLE